MRCTAQPSNATQVPSMVSNQATGRAAAIPSKQARPGTHRVRCPVAIDRQAPIFGSRSHLPHHIHPHSVPIVMSTCIARATLASLALQLHTSVSLAMCRQLAVGPSISHSERSRPTVSLLTCFALPCRMRTGSKQAAKPAMCTDSNVCRYHVEVCEK